MIVIGVDTHKRSHTLVALEAGTVMLRGQLTFPASDDGALDALRFTAVLDDERVWAIEDCRHVSGRLERGLIAHGERVVRVAPALTESSRRAVREPAKSDPIDATAIARAALRARARAPACGPVARRRHTSSMRSTPRRACTTFDAGGEGCTACDLGGGPCWRRS